MSQEYMGSGNFGLSVYPNPFTKWIGLGEEKIPDLIPYGFDVKSSDQSVEMVTILKDMGLMINTAEGNPTPIDSMKQYLSQVFQPQDFRLGFVATKNLIRDSKALPIMEQGARQIGEAYRVTKNQDAYDAVYNSAFTTALSADGATLISASHTTTSGTRSNLLAAASFSEAVVEQANLAVRNTYSDRGKILVAYITDLLIPPALQMEVSRVINNYDRPGTADRDINASTRSGIIPTATVVPYLTSSTAYFFRTNVDYCGPTFWNRQALETLSDVETTTENHRYISHARWMAGCAEFKSLYGSVGA